MLDSLEDGEVERQGKIHRIHHDVEVQEPGS